MQQIPLVAALAIALCAPAAFGQDREQPAERASTLDTLIVTGTRVSDRTVAESTSPIDIITPEALQATGTTELAREVVRELFETYRDAPREMPPEFAQAPDHPRVVADYIAGMTDRFAIREHHRLTGRRLFA